MIEYLILKDGVPIANISISYTYYSDNNKNELNLQIYFLDFWFFRMFPKEIVDGHQFNNFKEAEERNIEIQSVARSYKQDLYESAIIKKFTEQDKKRFAKMFIQAETIIADSYV